MIIKEFKKRKDILARHCKRKGYSEKYKKYHFTIATDFLFFCKKKKGLRKLNQIKEIIVKEYLQNLKNKGLSEKTISEHSRIIKKFCELYSIQLQG